MIGELLEHVESVGSLAIGEVGGDVDRLGRLARHVAERAFEAQIPFDRGFKLDDDRLYCAELVEKAFRSAGLPLSEPVPIGDWKNLGQFPLTSVAILCGSTLLLDDPITIDQRVYVPGDDGQGLWGSCRLETVTVTKPAV